VAIRVRAGTRVLADDAVLVTTPLVERVLQVGDGGIDDQHALAWSPRQPRLLDVEVALLDERGDVLDEVACDAALRTITVEDGQLLLNGRPYRLRFALDQGYWPDTGLTPPDTAALRRDIELAKQLGLNGVRKHQKVEDPRFLALADRLGLLVWVELPSAYRATPRSAARLLREWTSVVEQARDHPSVVAWVPVNESWGVPDLERDPTHVALLDALAATAHALDGSRPVSVNDGWETRGGELVGIHDYTQDPAVLRERYATTPAIDAMLTGRRFDGRLADLDQRPAGTRAVVLSEFGGVGLGREDDERAWGYVRARDAADLVRRVEEQWAATRDSALAGACWTQLTDTYQEVNGLLGFDRAPKAPLEDLARAIRGR
jgi:beta-galactosidase/beta-glucuronidase